MPQKTLRINLSEIALEQRSISNAATDSAVQNGYMQDLGSRKVVKIRPGQTLVPAFPGNTPVRTIYASNHTNKILVENYNNTITIYDLATGTAGSGAVITGVVVAYVEPYQLKNNPKILIVAVNGTTPVLYIINTDTSALTNVTPPANMDTPIAATSLDSYSFILDDKGRLFNSAIDDPTSWNTLSMIKPLPFLQTPRTVVRYLNYIVVFGDQSIVYLYDAGIAPPASPLALYQSSAYEIGVVEAFANNNNRNLFMFVGQDSTAGLGVYMLRYPNLVPQRISNPIVDALILEAGGATMIGNLLLYQATYFYILNGVLTGAALVYDIAANRWYRWVRGSGDFSVFCATNVLASTGINMNGRPPLSGTSVFAAQTVVGGVTQGIGVFYLDQESRADIQSDGSSVSIAHFIQTPNIDFDDMKEKQHASVEVVGDKLSGETMTLTYSDDDYATFSAARTLDIAAKRSVTRNLGNASRRAYRLTYSGTKKAVSQNLELVVELGSGS